MYPQRSVMTCGLATALEPPYFNHAPVWGATCPLRLWNMARTCFNPRTRVGCDMAPHAGHGLPALVSIHAPAWGATPCPDVPERAVRRFNPRTRVGCDLILKLFALQLLIVSGATRGDEGAGRGGAGVSIHAPAWGATKSSFGCRGSSAVSIHAPAWGATPSHTVCIRLSTVFQSTHPRGVRHCPLKFAWLYAEVSIHAPAWGATLAGMGAYGTGQGFNPRTRVGCDLS